MKNKPLTGWICVMEENEYKSTYQDIAKNRCVFEKALTNNQCRCSMSSHFWLADREGYACKFADNAAKCSELLGKLRESSRFSLKLKNIEEKLPHNMDIRVQAGGLLGLQQAILPDRQGQAVTDVNELVNKSIEVCGDLDSLPYSEIVKSVVQFQVRKRRNK